MKHHPVSQIQVHLWRSPNLTSCYKEEELQSHTRLLSAKMLKNLHGWKLHDLSWQPLSGQWQILLMSFSELNWRYAYKNMVYFKIMFRHDPAFNYSFKIQVSPQELINVSVSLHLANKLYQRYDRKQPLIRSNEVKQIIFSEPYCFNCGYISRRPRNTFFTLVFVLWSLGIRASEDLNRIPVKLHLTGALQITQVYLSNAL